MNLIENEDENECDSKSVFPLSYRMGEGWGEGRSLANDFLLACLAA